MKGMRCESLARWHYGSFCRNQLLRRNVDPLGQIRPSFLGVPPTRSTVAVSSTASSAPAAALVGPQISSPESDRCARGKSSHSDAARLVAVAARVPLLPVKPLDLLAVRVPHFGEHLGTCARVRARGRVRESFLRAHLGPECGVDTQP